MPEYCWEGYNGESPQPTLTKNECGSCNAIVLGQVNEETTSESGCLPCDPDGAYNSSWQNNYDPNQWDPLGNAVLEYCSNSAGGWKLFMWDHHPNDTYDGIDSGAWIYCPGSFNDNCGTNILAGCLDITADNYDRNSNVPCYNCCQYPNPADSASGENDGSGDDGGDGDTGPGISNELTSYEGVLFINQFASKGHTYDFIELYNSHTEDINLFNFRFGDNHYPERYCDLINLTIPAGGFVVIDYRDSDDWDCGEVDNGRHIVNEKLGGGDIINLYDPNGDYVDSFNYPDHMNDDNETYGRCGNGGNWGQVITNPTPGLGISQECPSSGCTNLDACNYDAGAVDDDGSCVFPIECPNTSPTFICLDTCPPIGTEQILINEISTKGTSHTLVADDIPETDVRDWVELYNPTDLPIDLNGWTFTDGDYPGEIDQRNILNEEFIIPAKGFAIVVADDCDGNTTGPWFDRYCEDHPGEGPGDQNILPGEGVQVDRETGNTASDTDLIWDRIYPNYPQNTPGVIRVSFKIGGTDSFKIYDGDPQAGGILVDQFSWIGNPSEEGESYARLWDGGPWGEVIAGGDVTYGTSNGIEPEDEPGDDSEVTYSQTLNLVTIEGTYRIDGLDLTSPENDVISLLYSGKNYQITNDTNVVDNKVKYSVTFDGDDLSEYAVGFNLKTTVGEDIVILRSSEVVPVTNILGGQIRYDVTFIYDVDSLVSGCTNPTSVNYSNSATLDDGSCVYTILGCDDPEACTCDNPLCLNLCNYCGTEQEYLCVAEQGFYNQNSNASSGNCTYPQNPIMVGFTTAVKTVEEFNWVSEYRMYTDNSGDEFMYTYLESAGDGGFNNDIQVDLNGNSITNYSFDVEGVHLRECELHSMEFNDCQLSINVTDVSTSINVICSTSTSQNQWITCSVNDIIKLHSCIKNPLFLNNEFEIQSQFNIVDGGNQNGACFDLNLSDNLETRLIKLNKLNGKLYTHISDLHRGENKYSTPVLAPFCCKDEWIAQEPEYDIILYPSCQGTVNIPPGEESCEGNYLYSCGAPNSGDVNASGTINVQDILMVISYVLDGTSALNNFTSDSGARIYNTSAGNDPLCNWNTPTPVLDSEPDGPPEYINNGIADVNGDGLVNVQDIIMMVEMVTDGITQSAVSTYTGNCRDVQDVCSLNIGCTYQPGSGLLVLQCDEIYDGSSGQPFGYSMGDCPNEEDFENCIFTEAVEDTENPYVPGTDRIVQHSSELLKCGDSIPQLGIINPLDFWDFDMDTLLDFYDNQPVNKFLEYRSECDDLGGYSNPTGYDDWRGDTGPFRDILYQMEYLGSDVDFNLESNSGVFYPHARYGALQVTNRPSSLLRQMSSGYYQTTSAGGLGALPEYRVPHSYSPLTWLLCNGHGFNGNLGIGDDIPLVNDEFCERVTPSDFYSEDDPYGWVAKNCCNNGQVKNSFKIPFYGVMPFFNTENYYYKYSTDNTFAGQYTMGYVPPCKEFAYNKITTALAFDETISDNIDELGFSYSIRVIEYETELISHVIITGDTLPSIWLGTLTDLNLGEGYQIQTYGSEFGSPLSNPPAVGETDISHTNPESRLLFPRFQMQYDSCGICSEGSALHISNSDKDFDDTCCLYPNNIIQYYQEDNLFNTGVGKTYLNSLNLCDSNDSIVTRTIIGEGNIVFHAEYNSDNCPGTLDCLGVCHEGLTIEDASLLTTYAQIDIYGGCCLQGNIDLCGICDGDSSSCDSSGWIPAQGFFELDIINSTQVVPVPVNDNFNTGMLDIQVNSDTDISEIKFKIVGLNITQGFFMNGSQQPDFNVYVTPVDGGTDIIISSILSDELFPTIDAGTFSITLIYDDIIYSADDFVLNESMAYIDWTTIQGMKLNQSIQSNNLENLFTNPLFYYGCGQPTSTNYDEVCEALDDCIEIASNGESYCNYSFIDCNGVVNGDAFLNICDICVGGNTDYIDENAFGGFYGQDCNGDCFGSAYVNSCNNCVMGNTGLPYNHNQDCFGICGGDATIDNCNVCNSPSNQNQNNGGCGCFVPAPIEHYLDNDLDGLGVDDVATNQFYCVVHNFSFGSETVTTGLAPNNYSPVAGDLDPICALGTQYDCGGNCIIDGFVCLGTLSLPTDEVTGEIIPGGTPVCDISMVEPLVLDDCNVCGGDNSTCTDECGVPNGSNDCYDCAGVPNGNNYQDCNGTCSDNTDNFIGNTGNLDNFGLDCAGVCNGTDLVGTYYYDGDGDGIGCADVTSWTGCSDNVPPNYVATDGETGASCNCPDTCNPVGFNIGTGSLSCIDECGICAGSNLDQDCNGVCFGTHLLDDCGACYDSDTEDPPNVCIGCMYPNASNYDVSYTISCENCCDFDDYIEDIYENPAIYIRGSMNVSYIGFLLPKTTSSTDLICAGTYGDNPTEDEYCATVASEGDDCNLLPPSECLPAEVGTGPPFLAECGCQDNDGDGIYDGYPDCALLASGCGWPGGTCQPKGTCEQYEVHRILVNSFYSDNPDDPTAWGDDGSCSDGNNPPCLQPFVANDEIFTQYQNEFGEDIIDGRILFNGSTQKWQTAILPDEKNIFKRSRGYYMKTTNSGWLKINAGLRNILDIQED